MEYNFNSPFSFGWNSSTPFLTNGFSGTNNNSTPAPLGFPQPPVNPQVSSHQHAVPGVVPGFNSDLLYGSQRLSAPSATGYAFGVNGQFNGNQSATGSTFPVDWNYGSYVNRLPWFSNPVVKTLPVSNSVNALPAQNIGVNGNDCSSGNTDVKSESCEKSKDDITSEIALKVSSLLSNPSIFQNAIIQMQGSGGEKETPESAANMM